MSQIFCWLGRNVVSCVSRVEWRERDLGCGMGSWLLWAESGLASHPLEDRDRDIQRLARLESVDTGRW